MDQVIKKPRLTSTTTSEHSYNFPDLISDLPDSLLLHILSLLNMEDVMKTCLLSRRWRYLWKSTPCLCFQRFRYSPSFTNFIHKCLFHHEGSKIQKLHIILDYFLQGRPALLIDSWIHIAITCKVEDLKLYFYDGENNVDMAPIRYKHNYKLPPSLYFCGTLTSLTLYRCNLNLPADSFQLSSLKKLSLDLIKLYPDSIERLSSSCPLLEEIYLINCNRDRDLLNIVITNKNVKRLEIFDYGYQEYAIKINAPTLLSLGIYEFYPLIRFHVEELGSLISADVIADESLTCFSDENSYFERSRNWLEKLIYELRHVKHLKLCCRCIQVLSILKFHNSNIFSISATCLELKASLRKWELPGITYLLQSCSNLEKLTIVNEIYDEILLPDEFIDKHDFKEEEYWASVETNLPSIMQNIKAVEIHLGGKSRHKEEFVRFSLKNAKVLERMVINTKGYVNKFGIKPLRAMFKLSQRLNAFPRSSPNAKLIIS